MPSGVDSRVDAALKDLVVGDDGRLRLAGEADAGSDAALAESLLATADAWAEEGHLIEATAAYAEAVLRDPALAAVYDRLSRVLVALERPDMAAAALRSALDLEPDRVEARTLLADLLQAKGDLAPAAAELETVVGFAPDHGRAHARLAVLLHYLGDADGARAHLNEAERLRAAVPGALRTILIDGKPRQAATYDGDAPRLTGKGSSREQVSIGPQVRVDSGGIRAADETSAASSELLPDEVVAAWHDYAFGTIRIAAGVSQNGGQSWVQSIVRAPVDLRESFEVDPMTAYDPRTGNLWVGGMAAHPEQDDHRHLFVARRSPGATFFGESKPIVFNQGLDKPWMAAGPRHDDPSTTQLYVAYRKTTDTKGYLQSSDDLGETWSSQINLQETCASSLPRVGPNGELYVACWTGFFGNRLLRSFDSGATVEPSLRIPGRMDSWGDETSRIPGQFRTPQTVYLAVDPNDGTLYLVFFDTTGVVGGNYDIDLYFSKSTDRGDTWTTPVVILDDPDPDAPGDQFFPWLEVDDSRRLHIVYYDTNNVTQNDDDEEGWIEAYYAVSSDRGDSWTRFRLTPSSFSSAYTVSPITTRQFLGDYIGLTVAGGIAHPVYVSTQSAQSGCSASNCLDVFTHAIEVFNQSPVAQDDDVVFGPEVEIRPLDNDYDPDPGDLLSLVGFTQPQGEGSEASVEQVDATTLLYRNPNSYLAVLCGPAPPLREVDRFTYTVGDGSGTDTATVSIVCGSDAVSE